MKNKNTQRVFEVALLFLTISLSSVILASCSKIPHESIGIAGVDEFPNLDESIPAEIPHVHIDISGGSEVVVKEQYLNGEVTILSNGQSTQVDPLKTKIRGRGNSTWNYPKKPYRLKLDQEASLLGLPAAKNWVLLANYNDYTLMTNAIAMKIGKQLGMPFTPDIVAVDLTINGKYRGSYNLTQQVEVHENRVNVGEGGVLWELDSYFDEEFKFIGVRSNLPVMLKDPDPETDEQFQQWRAEFQHFDNLLYSNSFPNNKYGNLFDKQQFVNFLIVNMLVGNNEICHPKSVFIHKKLDGKYTMGPLWDFDFAFGFSEDHKRTYFNYVNLPLIKEDDERIGTAYYSRIIKDYEVRVLFNKTWQNYKSNKFDELLLFIEEFAARIRESQKQDYMLWKTGNNNHAQNKADIKRFLRQRTLVVDDFIKQL